MRENSPALPYKSRESDEICRNGLNFSVQLSRVLFFIHKEQLIDTKKQIRLRDYIARYKRDIVLTVLCVLATVSVNLTLPYIMRLGIDGLSDNSLDRAELIRLIALYGGLALLGIPFSIKLRTYPLKLAHKVEYEIRRDLFAHLTSLEQEFFRKERTGDLMTRMSSDMNIVRDAIGQGLLQGLRTSGILIFATTVMLFLDIRLTLMIILLYLPMSYVFYKMIRVMREKQEILQEQVSELSNFSQESFAGIRCIKGFALEARRTRLFGVINREMIGKHVQVQFVRQGLWPFMAFWFALSMVLILTIGGSQVIKGDRSIGTLVQFIQYLLYMQWPLLALSWITSLTQRGKVSWERIQSIFSRAALIRNPAPDTPTPENLRSTIEFKDVSLDIENRRLLHSINLKIPNGQTLGITGPTGSGKTLFVSLVARLMDPSEGSILIGGTKLPDMPLQSLRGTIGFAAQEPILFSRTLKENIGFGLDEDDQERIDWAAEVAHLHGDISGFPDGFETLLGERGVTLSGGQRQRSSISRAIARRPDILILDDVLASVDTQTEAAIMGKLQPVMNERSTLFVSHRISTLRYADSIIVIEDGRITQQGSHQDLLGRPGYYAELNDMQQDSGPSS